MGGRGRGSIRCYATRIAVLAGVWAVALVGAGFRVVWVDAPRWLYVALPGFGLGNEVFHSATVAAFVCQYVAASLVIYRVA